jgi:hypothetical protein
MFQSCRLTHPLNRIGPTKKTSMPIRGMLTKAYAHRVRRRVGVSHGVRSVPLEVETVATGNPIQSENNQVCCGGGRPCGLPPTTALM